MTNKELVTAFFEYGYNHCNFEAVEKLLAADYYDHSPAAARSVGEAVAVLRSVAEAYTRMKVEIVDLIEENDKVAGRFVFTAAQNGQTASWEALETFRLADGKIVESWGYWPELPFKK